MAHYNLPLGDEGKNFDRENFINKEKLSQPLSGYEHQFSVDDVVRNGDETITSQRMAKWNKVMLVEAWKRENKYSYTRAFDHV